MMTGAWVADQATVTTEPTTVLTWVQDSGTWTNTETRDVRIKFAKNGGTAAGGGSNTDKLMYIDDASLTYASAITSSGESIPWTDSFETTDVWTNDSGSYPWTYGLAASFENPPAAAQDGDAAFSLMTILIQLDLLELLCLQRYDLSSATDPNVHSIIDATQLV